MSWEFCDVSGKRSVFELQVRFREKQWLLVSVLECLGLLVIVGECWRWEHSGSVCVGVSWLFRGCCEWKDDYEWILMDFDGFCWILLARERLSGFWVVWEWIGSDSTWFVILVIFHVLRVWTCWFVLIRGPCQKDDDCFTQKSLQHQHFPRGPPPQYYAGRTQVHFTVKDGTWYILCRVAVSHQL